MNYCHRLVPYRTLIVEPFKSYTAPNTILEIKTTEHAVALQVTAAQNGDIVVKQTNIVVKDVSQDLVGTANNDGYYEISQVTQIILWSKYFGALVSHLDFIVLTYSNKIY
jgi:hypothetical protein